MITDYPSDNLLENVRRNVEVNFPGKLKSSEEVVVLGHLWGSDITPLLKASNESGKDEQGDGYDLIILAELLWR